MAHLYQEELTPVVTTNMGGGGCVMQTRGVRSTLEQLCWTLPLFLAPVRGNEGTRLSLRAKRTCIPESGTPRADGYLHVVGASALHVGLAPAPIALYWGDIIWTPDYVKAFRKIDGIP